MSAKPKRRCVGRGCRRWTRSTQRLCDRCKTGRAPDVARDGDGVLLEGIGHLDYAAALALAHKLADALTPGCEPR
jgi:hypothetical protein